jgi:hypothetical protein
MYVPEGGGWSMPRPGLITPVPTVQEAGWVQKIWPAPGFDHHTVQPIESLCRLCYPGHTLINTICNKGDMPEQWKESIIVPIYKKGDRTDCSNYRGISFLSTTYKILSNLLQSRLTPFIYSVVCLMTGP